MPGSGSGNGLGLGPDLGLGFLLRQQSKMPDVSEQAVAGFERTAEGGRPGLREGGDAQRLDAGAHSSAGTGSESARPVSLSRATSESTVRPPRPESNMPIGFFFIRVQFLTETAPTCNQNIYLQCFELYF